MVQTWKGKQKGVGGFFTQTAWAVTYEAKW
jgi:hypothetical protein